LTPSDVTVGYGKKVWWQCAYGHEWEAVIVNRKKILVVLIVIETRANK